MTEIRIFITEQQDAVILEAKACGIITCLKIDRSDCLKMVEALRNAILELNQEENKP